MEVYETEIFDLIQYSRSCVSLIFSITFIYRLVVLYQLAK